MPAKVTRLEWREQWGFISDRRITVCGTEWGIGDRMVCRRNDYALGVRNGTQGTVVQLDRYAEHLDLRTDYGQLVRIPADYLAHARHGYALTGHVSQGESVDRSFVLAGPERGGAEWAYVAGSRRRHDLQVFVVHHEAENVEEALARAWSRSQAKSLALDLVDPADRNTAMDAARDDVAALTPEALPARAEALRAKREVARQAAASVPDHERARVAELWARVVRAELGERGSEELAARLGQRLDRIPAWRRGERVEVRAGIVRAGAEAERHRGVGRTAREELTRFGSVADGSASERASGLSAEPASIEHRLNPWRDGRGAERRGGDMARDERAQLDRGLGR